MKLTPNINSRTLIQINNTAKEKKKKKKERGEDDVPYLCTRHGFPYAAWDGTENLFSEEINSTEEIFQQRDIDIKHKILLLTF